MHLFVSLADMRHASAAEFLCLEAADLEAESRAPKQPNHEDHERPDNLKTRRSA
jgi:hypothetical protein